MVSIIVVWRYVILREVYLPGSKRIIILFWLRGVGFQIIIDTLLVFTKLDLLLLLLLLLLHHSLILPFILLNGLSFKFRVVYIVSA